MSMIFDSTPQYWSNRLSFALRKELTTRFHNAGITASAEDWATLRFLSQGPQPTSALSDATLRDRTTVTRLVDRLVRNGWVERRADAGDRRRLNLALSADGQIVFDKMTALAGTLLTQTNAGIAPAEQQVAVSVLQRMFANLTDAALEVAKDV